MALHIAVCTAKVLRDRNGIIPERLWEKVDLIIRYEVFNDGSFTTTYQFKKGVSV